MANRTTYTQARAKLASLCDRVAETREPYVIERRNGENVALISEAELNSLLETAHLLRSPRKGKIQQLNAALALASGEIIVNTDVDTIVEPGALEVLAREFCADENVGVVGAYCGPNDDALAVDRYYWDAQNCGRLLESGAGCASIVVAPCYGFRRDLLDCFPDDVVADDIYVAFQSAAQGRRVERAACGD